MEFFTEGMKAGVQTNKGLKRWLSGSTLLKFAEAGGKGFRVTLRNGFANADLIQFYRWLKES